MHLAPKKSEGKPEKERELQCLPCLRAALHGNDSGACLESTGSRCLRCFRGRSSERCVPVPLVARLFAAGLRAAIEAGEGKSVM